MTAPLSPVALAYYSMRGQRSPVASHGELIHRTPGLTQALSSSEPAMASVPWRGTPLKDNPRIVIPRSVSDKAISKACWATVSPALAVAGSASSLEAPAPPGRMPDTGNLDQGLTAGPLTPEPVHDIIVVLVIDLNVIKARRYDVQQNHVA